MEKVREPLSNQQLLDLYRIALDEYRFQVRLNWDRTTYHFSLSSALMAIAAGLIRFEGSSLSNLAVSLVFIIGMFVSAFGIKTIWTGHQYYRNTIVKKTLIEDQLGLTQPVEGYEVVHTLAVGTTVGQGQYLQILNNTKAWQRRALRPNNITVWIIVILFLFSLANLAGTIMAFYLYAHPSAIPHH